MNKILLFLSLMLFVSGAIAQDGAANQMDSKFLMISQPYGDSIKLRWSPTSYDNFMEGNGKGYLLTRFEIGGDPAGVKREIKLRPEQDWQAIAENDDMAFLAGGIIYGGLEALEMGSSDDKVNLYQAYQKEQSNNYQYAYCMYAADNSFQTAEYLGLGFVDKDIQRGKTYIYELSYLVNPVQKQKLIVSSGDPISLPKPINSRIQFLDGVAVINWNTEILSQRYISYDVEKSTDMGRTYVQMNKAPIVHLKTSDGDHQLNYVDSLAQNGQTTYYRISGNNPFGDKGPYSDPLIGKGIPAPLQASAQIVDVVEYPVGTITLRWSFEEEFESRIKGFDIYMSDEFDGEFSKVTSTLIPADGRKFVETNPQPKSFYKVIAVDENDHQLGSFPVMSQLEDLIAPLAPTMLQGELDEETGIVSLNWNANEELDLQGYRVFYSNDPVENFIQHTETSINELTYQHQISMKLGNKSIYYKILAVDFRENYSKFSETIEVKKPDNTPPTAPVIMVNKVNKENVEIKYGKSESRDIQHQALMRKMKDGDGDWEEVMDLTADTGMNYFKDSTLKMDVPYLYKIVVNDFDENFNESKVVEAQLRDSKFSNIFDFSLSFDRMRKGIRLDWKYNTRKEVSSFVIYRGEEGAPVSTYEMVAVKNAENLNFSFMDNGIKPKKSYSYKILGQNADGSYSELSPEKVIKI